AFDHETDRADERTGLSADDGESGTGAIDPGRTVQSNPFSGSAVRVRMRNVERRVGDFTHSSEALDVERIMVNEGPQGESVGRERRLVVNDPRFYVSPHLSASFRAR